jgi:hypothetical protein
MNHEDRENFQRARRQKTLESNAQCEIIFSACIGVYLVGSMLFGYTATEANCGNFLVWLKWSLLFYCLDMILGLN